MRASAIERFAYGTPLSDEEDRSVRVAERSGTLLIGRTLIGLIFLFSGFHKLSALGPTAAQLAQVGLPSPHVLAAFAGAAELLGGAALIFGFLARPAAVGLILFMIPTTLLFHNFWAYTGNDMQVQLINFMKNLAIIGGLALVVGSGAGRYSIDGKLRSPKQA